jgi:hypothetical protein
MSDKDPSSSKKGKVSFGDAVTETRRRGGGKACEPQNWEHDPLIQCLIAYLLHWHMLGNGRPAEEKGRKSKMHWVRASRDLWDLCKIRINPTTLKRKVHCLVFLSSATRSPT